MFFYLKSNAKHILEIITVVVQHLLYTPSIQTNMAHNEIPTSVKVWSDGPISRYC